MKKVGFRKECYSGGISFVIWATLSDYRLTDVNLNAVRRQSDGVAQTAKPIYLQGKIIGEIKEF
jgi:hypothetical protein